jgi:nucleotide-binding universal stress UspA family protein
MLPAAATDMASQRFSPYTILAAIDYSETASLVVQEAVDLAREKHAAALHFLHVHPWPIDDAGQEARHTELLEWLGARLQGSQGLLPEAKVIGHEVSGEPSPMIVDLAAELSADAVIVGTHGRKGMQRLLLGSVAAAVVKDCGCPVLVVRAKHHAHTPVQIEPACPRCLETRAHSDGKIFWCEEHSRGHGRRHTYYDPHVASWVTQRLMS